MRWIVVVPVLVALAMALTGPALAQELRIFENIEQSAPPVAIVGRPPVTLEIPPAPPVQPLGDKGVR
ncbi:MAG: hypothetical protein ACRDGN_09045 [bacterium]